MPAVALLANKGGVGKTTLALNLAVAAGSGALLIDLDPEQRSSAEWFQSRATDYPKLATGDPQKLPRAVAALATDQWAIIDTAPNALADAEIIAGAVDLVAVPTQPSIVDLRTIRRVVEITRRHGRRAVIVLNRATAGRGGAEAADTSRARRALAAYGLPVAPVAIGDRVAFRRAFEEGQAVAEYDPGGRGAKEIEQLWGWLHAEATRRV